MLPLRVVIHKMDIKRQFFIDKNKVSVITESDEAQLYDYKAVAEAIGRATFQTVYIIDYYRQGFDYVSENPLFLCGHTPDEYIQMGYEFYARYVHPEDLAMLVFLNDKAFDFFDELPLDQRKNYHISYDFRLVCKGNTIMVHHKITPLFLNADGRIWKALCIVSLSSQTEAGNIIISKQGSALHWKLNTITSKWTACENLELSSREKEVLLLSGQGLAIHQIAEKLFLSADTIKFHRKKIFEKLDVNSISEAITYALNHKLV